MNANGHLMTHPTMENLGIFVHNYVLRFVVVDMHVYVVFVRTCERCLHARKTHSIVHTRIRHYALLFNEL